MGEKIKTVIKDETGTTDTIYKTTRSEGSPVVDKIEKLDQFQGSEHDHQGITYNPETGQYGIWAKNTNENE